MSRISVRDIIDDVPAAIRFSTTLLGFTVEQDAALGVVLPTPPRLAGPQESERNEIPKVQFR